MLEIDFFNFFRYTLALLVTIYATAVTVHSLWQWYVWLAGSDKFVSMLRRYLVVHGLRLRFTSFWVDLAICILLTMAFSLIWQAHRILYDINAVLNAR